MRLVRPRRSPRLIATGLGVALAAGLGVQPAHAASSAPTADYALDYSTIWTGQKVTLTESNLADDNTPPDLITRTVNWGDGTTDLLLGTDSTIDHSYRTTGTFAVTVELEDLDGTAAGEFAGASAVSVTSVPGTFRLDKKTVYVADRRSQALTLRASGLPAASVQVEWCDGEGNSIASKGGSVKHRYPYSGNFDLTVSLSNGAGTSSPRKVGTVAVKLDFQGPKIVITKPKNANKVSSWKTIRGKVSDPAGVRQAYVVLWQVRGASTYYYNGKKWVKGKINNANFNKAIKSVSVNSKGLWAYKVKGLKKGELIAGVMAFDQVDTRSSTISLGNVNYVQRVQKLTR